MKKLSLNFMISLTFVSCGEGLYFTNSGSGGSVDRNVSTANEEMTELQLGHVGVKDFNQVVATMSQVTGIPVMNADSASAANTVLTNSIRAESSNLPNDNNLTSFSASHQVAATKIAFSFCNDLMDSTTLRTAILPANYNVARNAARDLSAVEIDSFISNLRTKFFPVETLAHVPDVSLMKTELSSMITELQTAASNVNNINVMKLACGVVLANSTLSLF